MTSLKILSIACGALMLGGCADDKSCSELKQDAMELVISHQACAKDSDCKEGPSFDCFRACGTVINQKTDASSLQRDGQALAAEYKEQGCGCSEPLCVDPSDSRPACVDGLCGSRAD